jgi:hypothetical protein
MARSAALTPVDQKHCKEVFEGSLTRLNGNAIPASKQPIFQRLRQTTAVDSSKDAIATAAASLAALWQISSPSRLQRS